MSAYWLAQSRSNGAKHAAQREEINVNVVESSPETGKERVKKVQLVLTSHSTHIAPEGGAAFIKPVWTHTHTRVRTQQHTHKYTHIYTCTELVPAHTHPHRKTHTNIGGYAQTGWAAFTSQCRASDFFTSQLCSAFFWKRRSVSFHISSHRQAGKQKKEKKNVKTCKEYSEKSLLWRKGT